MRPRHFFCIACLLPVVVSASLAREPEPVKPAAPSTQAPASPAPASNPPPKPEELLRELDRSRQPRPAIKPTLPGTVTAGLPGTVRIGPNTVSAGRVIRQGTFLMSRRGTITRAEGGEVIFTFDPDEHGAADPPMTLLPNMHLQNLERIGDRADATARFNVSGQVMAFRGRNYLLMDRPAEIVRASAPKPPEPKANAGPANTADPTSVINKLEDAARDRDATRPVLATGPASASPPAGPSLPPVPSDQLIREGTSLTSRRGRMVRQPNGDWALMFDADAAGKSEPALLLLPCLNLQTMERTAERGGEAATMSVSGIVTTYKSRNYLLPTMFIINRPADIVPGQ